MKKLISDSMLCSTSGIPSCLTKSAAFAAVVLAMGSGVICQANITGPYAADADTAYLFHFDEASGSSIATNSAFLTAGTNAVSYNGAVWAGVGTNQPTVTTVLGATAFAGFGNAADVSATVNLGLGVDNNNDGAYMIDERANSPTSADRLPNHSTIFGAGNRFTLEALVKVSTITSGNQEIICTDNGSVDNNLRGFQFRINGSGLLEFNFIGVNTSTTTAMIPTTGDNAFVAGEWFHAAYSYDGTTGTFFWTRMNATNTTANSIGSAAEGVDVTDPACLVFGNEGRNSNGTTDGSTEGLKGSIDEVRISKFDRKAGEMMFHPTNIIFTTQPASSVNLYVNQSTNISARAAGPGPIAYQWYSFATGGSTNLLANQTNTTLTVNAGSTPAVTNFFSVASNGGVNTPATSQVATVTISLLPQYTWDGGGANDNWTTGVNWVSDTAPPTNGAFLIFAGATRPNPNMDTSFSIVSLVFSNNATGFTIGSSNGSTLSLSQNLTNNSTAIQTLSVPITPFTGSTIINAGTVAIGGAAQWGAGTYAGSIAISNGAAFNYNSSTNQTLSGLISGSGNLHQTGSGTLTVTSRSTNFTGAVNVGAGTLIPNPGNQANPGAFSYVSGITVSNGATLQSGPNGLFGWDGSLTKPITVNTGGVLATTATGVDVNVGTVTLNGGTLAGFSSGTWGSFNFKRAAGGKLIATENSSVTATNVGLGTNNYVDVSASKTLTWSGPITDLSSEGQVTLIKSNGTGTLVLTATNTYTGGTTNLAGTLQVGAGGVSGSIVGNVLNDGSLIFNHLGNYTIGSISGSGTSITKQGSGRLTLTGNITHSTGSVAVQGGELGFFVPSGSCNNFTLSSGVTNSLNKTDGSGNMNVFGTYTLNNNVLNMNFGAASGFPDHFIFATTLSASGVTTINITGTGLGTGVKNLIQFGTGPAGLANFALGTLPAGVSGVLTNTGNFISLNITTAGKSLTWNGWDEVSTLLPVWSVGGSTNWHDTIGGTNAQYAVGDNVIFGDYHFGSGATNITLNTAVIPSSMVVNSALYDYTITGSGSIGGGMTLIKSNAAALTLGTSNTYTGGTLINGGTLSISNNNALGNTAGNVTIGNSTLRFNAGVTNSRAISMTAGSTFSTATNTTSLLSGVISGSASLAKAGNGKLTLAGTNTYTGATFAQVGTLTLTGTIPGPGNTYVGATNGAFLEISGGSLTANELVIGNNDGATTPLATTGTVSMTSGTVQANDWLLIGRQAGNGTFNQSGGTVTHTGAGGRLNLGWHFSGAAGAGTYNLSGTAVLNANASGNPSLSLGDSSGETGIMVVSGNASVTNLQDMFVGNLGTGTLTITNSGWVTVPANKWLLVGANAAGTGTVNLAGGTLDVRHIQENGTATINLNGGRILVNSAADDLIHVNADAFVQAGGGTIDTAGFNKNLGAALRGDGGSPGGGLTKNGAGTLFMHGVNTYLGTTTVAAGTLGGTGSFAGPVIVSASGTLAPGASIGTMTVSNNLNFVSGNVFAEVNNTNAQTSDLTVVTGGLTNTGPGTVTVTNLGPALAVGNTFTLFSKPVVGGGSMTISGPAGVTWTNELATLGQIRVLTASSTPSPTLLTNSYNGTNLTLSWPAGQGWRLQQQITNRAVGLNTNWTAITDSSVSSTNITPDKANGTVFYRLINP